MDKKENPLYISPIKEKLKASCKLLSSFSCAYLKGFTVPEKIKRDILILPAKEHPPKKGLSYLEGKQRLLHDLASIELQAMELGLRTLIDFSKDSKIPKPFLEELAAITKEEALHCKLCLENLEALDGFWGMFPVHLGLWGVADRGDSILERLLKVHRFLEGSGLDAGHTLVKRFQSVKGSDGIKELLCRIANDEIKHVQFGSKWFAFFCEKEDLSRISECKRILTKFRDKLPFRREPINEKLRLEAGFTKEEVEVFKEYQKGNHPISR